MMDATLRVLVVDDERPARIKIRRMLGEIDGVEIVGEADDGQRAVAMVRTLQPDVMLLDVQMPGLDGFGVIAELSAEPPLPHVVFLTAFDEYAVKAFEVNALDYLLKPVPHDRLVSAMGRAREARSRSAPGSIEARLERMLEEVGRAPRYLERVMVEDGERHILVRLADVTWIESARNYAVLHVGAGTHTVRGTLTMLEERLDPSRWLRVNRSAIVSIDAIAQLEPWFHGEFRVILRDGTRTTWTRRFLGRADEILGKASSR